MHLELQTPRSHSSRPAVDPSLYLVINPEQCRYFEPVELAILAAQGGVSAVQIRSKSLSDQEFKELADKVSNALQPYPVSIFVNDRVSVATATGVKGIHLGQDDESVTTARRALGPQASIGLTVRSIEEAKSAPLTELSYVSVGGVFATESKFNPDPPIGLKMLATIVNVLRSRNANCPIIAISGIHSDNLRAVLQTGVDGVAVVSAICESQSPKSAARELKRIIEEHLHHAA